MQKSILDAVREGVWDYEPNELPINSYDATAAIPGSAEKLKILADRAEQGLPLWHVSDRLDYDGPGHSAEISADDSRTELLTINKLGTDELYASEHCIE